MTMIDGIIWTVQTGNAIYNDVAHGLAIGHPLYIGGAALTAASAYYAYSAYQRATRAIKDRTAAHGNARFAEIDEVNEMNIRHDGSNYMTLGVYGGGRIGAPVHALVAAPTGCGKGVGVVIPTLLSYQGSVVVNDPKGENLAITSRYREDCGQRIISYDPWGLGAKLCGRPSQKCNPMDYINLEKPDAVTKAKQLARAIAGDPPSSGNPFFHQRAEFIIVFYILFAKAKFDKEAQSCLPSVRQMIMSSPADMAKHFEEAQTLTQCRGEIAVMAANLAGTAFRDGVFDEAFASVMQTISNLLDFLSDECVKDFFSANDCELGSIQDDPTSVYIIVSPAKQEISAVLMRVIYSVIIQCQYERDTEPADRPLLLIIDELAQLGNFSLIEKGISIMRGYGMRLLLICQAFAQIDKCYGKAGSEDIQANCTKAIFAPSTHEMRVKTSQMLGNKTIDVTSCDSKGRKTTSQTARPMMTPQEVAQCRDVLIFPMQGLPVRARHIKYYADKKYQGRYDPRFHHIMKEQQAAMEAEEAAAAKGVEGGDDD